MTPRDLATIATILVPLGVAIVEHRGKVEAEEHKVEIARVLAGVVEVTAKGAPCR